MSKIDPRLVDLLKTYGEDGSACWDCHGTWVAYHAAIERMAAKANIKFDIPMIILNEPGDGAVCILVEATMGERHEWSFGEVSNKNNKNSYPYAMAEKRAKDRVALKLLGMAGMLYSEEEADDFKNSRPEVTPTRPANQLKKDGAWEGLITKLDAEMSRGPTLVEFDTEMKRWFWNEGKKLGFNDTWMEQLKDELLKRRADIEAAQTVDAIKEEFPGAHTVNEQHVLEAGE